MSDEQFMQIALNDAQEAKKSGNLPSATILVKDDKIIARGVSRVGPDFDPSAHGDIVCIRTACKELSVWHLTSCTLYSVIEPCAMCLTCASWAQLSRVVFGAYKEDIAENSYLLDGYHAEEFSKKLTALNNSKIEVVGGVLRNACAAIMTGVNNWSPK
jgi:tRNA(Arg) A34 adenosine deaminase TadA